MNHYHGLGSNCGCALGDSNASAQSRRGFLGAMGAMAGAMEAMLPELAKVAEQMRGALPAGLPDDAPFDPDEPPAGEAAAD